MKKSGNVASFGVRTLGGFDRLPLLSREEEYLLGQAIARARSIKQATSEAEKTVLQAAKIAREKLILHNLRLVAKWAVKYARRYGMEADDLFQEGVLGLNRAIDTFDPERRLRFITFAGHWVKQAMDRYAQYNGRTVRIPTSAHARQYQAQQAALLLTQRHVREPTVQEVAQYLEWDPKQVDRLRVHFLGAVSTSDIVSEDGERTREETLTDENARTPEQDAAEEELIRIMKQVLLEIRPERARTVLYMRLGMYGLRMHTLQEIGELMGNSREWARQLEARALKQVREHPLILQLVKEQKK